MKKIDFIVYNDLTIHYYDTDLHKTKTIYQSWYDIKNKKYIEPFRQVIQKAKHDGIITIHGDMSLEIMQEILSGEHSRRHFNSILSYIKTQLKVKYTGKI